MDGFGKLEGRKSDQMKKHQPDPQTRSIAGGTAKKSSVNSIQQLRSLPGVKKIPRKRH